MGNIPPAYRGQGEFQFLKMIVEEIEKGGYRPGSTFRKESELYVYGRFRSVLGPMYSDRLLRSRFRTLRRRHKEFSDLINKPGIYWDKKSNVVYGDEELLRAEHKNGYKQGHYYGERNFELMCQVFESGVKFK